MCQASGSSCTGNGPGPIHQDLAGRSILLYGEQGLRRRHPVRALRAAARPPWGRGGALRPPPLVDLLRRLPGVSVVAAGERLVPRTDWICALMGPPPFLPPRALRAARRAARRRVGELPGGTARRSSCEMRLRRWRTRAGESPGGVPSACDAVVLRERAAFARRQRLVLPPRVAGIRQGSSLAQRRESRCAATPGAPCFTPSGAATTPYAP